MRSKAYGNQQLNSNSFDYTDKILKISMANLFILLMECDLLHENYRRLTV